MEHYYCKYGVKYIIILTLLCYLTPRSTSAQGISKLYIGVGHGYGISMADLGDRFGNSWQTTGGVYYHNFDKNYIIGIEGSGFYGNIVHEDILANLRNSESPLLGINQTVSDVKLRERGFSGYATVEKIITFGQDGFSSSGLKIGAGLGFMSHYIRIQDDTVNNAYFQGDYVQGYNRYSFGPAAKQFIGYHLANQAFNYGLSIGVEIEEGFTSSRRAIDFATGVPIDDSRLDILTTLKAKFYLNIGTYGNTESLRY